MIFGSTCPRCGGELKHYDYVKRPILTKNREKRIILLERKQCLNCGSVQRVATDEIVPYKRYEAILIFAVLDGVIDSNTLGYEDYPCEVTMLRWTRNLHTPL